MPTTLPPARFLLPLAVLGLLGLAAAGATDLTQTQKLVRALPATGDQLGYAVAADGEWAVLGAPYGDGQGTDTGVVTLFRRSGSPGAYTWTEFATRSANDGLRGDLFGWAVSLHGDCLVVSAPGDDDDFTDSGTVYVYRFDSDTQAWNQEAKLRPEDTTGGLQFGQAVAVYGDLVLVGAPYWDGTQIDCGAVYAFRHTENATTHAHTWTQEARLTAPVQGYHDYFGTAVDLYDDLAAVGASEDDDQGDASGSAFVFLRTPVGEAGAWSLEAQVNASDAATGDRFGSSVAIDNGWLLVGAPQEDRDYDNQGAAYSFARAAKSGGGYTWSQTAKLYVSTSANNDRYGTSVALEGDLAVIGAPYFDATDTDIGAAYAYQRTSSAGAWTLKARLLASDRAYHDYLGWAVAVADDEVIAGAFGDDREANDLGAGYAYDLLHYLLPQVSITATDNRADEAGPDTGTFTITRTHNISTMLVVEFHVSGTAIRGSDYDYGDLGVTENSGYARIPAGAYSVDLTVTPLADAENEPDETVILTLISGNGYMLGDKISDTVTISDTAARQATESFVSRLYQYLLGRTADAAGLKEWADRLQAGTDSGGDVARGLFLTAEFTARNLSDSAYLDALYWALCNRAADAAGQADWLAQLGGGRTREDLLLEFVCGVEFASLAAGYNLEPTNQALRQRREVRAFVRRFYQYCLVREGESAGLGDWTDQLINGTRQGGDVARGFVGSDEFTARGLSDGDYLDVLYRAFFAREADSAGKAGWLAQLAGGTSRATVLEGFIGAIEFHALCQQYGINP